MRVGKLRGAMALVLILALAVTAVALIAGCGGRSTTSDSSPSASGAAGIDVTKVAVITPEKGNDYGWNQMGVESAQKAAAATGATVHRRGRCRLR